MKTVVKVLCIFVVIVFFSCERGEEFAFTKHQLTKGYVYSDLIFTQMYSDTLRLLPIDMFDVLGDSTVAKKTTKVVLEDSMFIEVVGLRSTDTLKNVILFLKHFQDYGDKEKPVTADQEEFSLGNLYSDKRLTGTAVEGFFKTLSYFYNYGIRQPVPMIKFNATDSIYVGDSVRLNISFKGTYDYIVLE